MRQEIISHHNFDDNGKPAGGVTTSTGLEITWQNGPLGRGEDRQEPNGCFVETVIAAAIDRLKWYEDGEFACKHNREALYHLDQAQQWLDQRTKAREELGIEGTHETGRAVEETIPADQIETIETVTENPLLPGDDGNGPESERTTDAAESQAI